MKKNKSKFLKRNDEEEYTEFHKRCFRESFVEMIIILENVKENGVHKKNLIKKLQELSK